MTSLLFITSAPDERESTANLSRLAAEVDRRAGCSGTVWYLRCATGQEPRPGTRTVDDLRTWPAARAVDAVGLPRVAAAMRGARLRWWLHRVGPDVVVLDDGVGRRVVEHLRPAPAIVVRCNPSEPAERHLEGPAEDRPDAWLMPPDSEHTDHDGATIVERRLLDAPARRFGEVEERRRRRRALGLPVDETLVVGWGDDGWLDGPDLFVRTLWVLHHRHGLQVHGVWFGTGRDEHETNRLRTEAERCGLQDHFHLRATASPEDHLCGDAVLLPYRCAADSEAIAVAMWCGTVTVAFAVAGLVHPLVVQVPDLDLDAAAGEIAAGLDVSASQRRRAAQPFADEALEVVDDLIALAPQR